VSFQTGNYSAPVVGVKLVLFLIDRIETVEKHGAWRAETSLEGEKP
jgi:hypothetical protein